MLIQWAGQVPTVPYDYAVPSVTRAMKILELLAQSQRGLTLADVSRKLGVPKSSVHVLMRTLEDLGYLKSSELKGKYSVGLKLVSLSNIALENLDLREQARTFLQDLVLRTKLTVHLAILEGVEAVIIEKFDAAGMLRLATWVGKRLDANSSGVGKALLAFAPEETYDHQLKRKSLARHNRNTISSPEALRRELKKIRALGYAFEDEEGEIGFRCIGAPLYDARGHVVAAISIAGTTSQIPRAQVASLASTVKETAAHISRHLGYDKDAK